MFGTAHGRVGVAMCGPSRPHHLLNTGDCFVERVVIDLQQMSPSLDAIIIGSGPNGLSAAVALASWGFSVRVYEAHSTIGGGLRSIPSEDEGFLFDECSAVHPTGVLSPFFRALKLEEFGLTWKHSRASVAHPFDDGPAAILDRERAELGERIDPKDAKTWGRLFAPLSRDASELLPDLMGPLSLLPRNLIAALRFGWLARRSCAGFAHHYFKDVRAQSLFAGLSAHSILPLEMPLTAAFGSIFATTAGVTNWPCAEGGSQSIAQALTKKLESLGGEILTGTKIESPRQLPESRTVLLDISPRAAASLFEAQLPARYRRRLNRFVYGPGTFKMDWTLDGSIPWKDPGVIGASTVHLGGSLQEIAASERAAWNGEAPQSPYLILCQQSELDSTRAPAGRHTGYAYCHVPHGYTGDASELIEAQVERFAPGFRDLIRTRRATSPAEFQSLNPNNIGGAITGGAATFDQLFTRPVARLDPYSTPNPRLFFCSASTPPGGGVHGMCGYHAARSAARRMGKSQVKNSLLDLTPYTGD